MQSGIVATTIFLTYILIDIIFDQEFWEGNIKLTIWLQQNSFEGEQAMFEFFSISLYIVPAAALILFLFFDQKLKALIYGSLIVFTTSLNNVLKNLYHQPRPYMLEDEILALECSKEFGKPSGHAMGSFVMCFMMPAIMFPELFSLSQRYSTLETLRYSRSTKFVITVFLSAWVFMTGLSRIYLGVHSFGQILLGWAFSAYFCFMFLTFVNQPLQRYYFKSIRYLIASLAPEGPGLSRLFVGSCGLAVGSWILFSFIIFQLNANVIMEEDFTLQLIGKIEQCGTIKGDALTNSSVLYNNCFYQSLIVAFLFGEVLGISQTQAHYEEGKFKLNYQALNRKEKGQRLLLLLLALLPALPFELIYFFIPNVYIACFLSFLPFCFLSGFLLIYGYTKLLHHFKVDIQGDFLYIEASEQIKQHLLQDQNRSNQEMVELQVQN